MNPVSICKTVLFYIKYKLSANWFNTSSEVVFPRRSFSWGVCIKSVSQLQIMDKLILFGLCRDIYANFSNVCYC